MLSSVVVNAPFLEAFSAGWGPRQTGLVFGSSALSRGVAFLPTQAIL